jgi:hypothetical protein
MARKIKLDLHTHPIEALREKMGIKGIGNINREVAAEIVKAVKSAGLDGIAITERNNFNHGWVACLEILDHYPGEKLIILPGTEIEVGQEHFLQIYIPDRYRRRIPFFNDKEWFLILAQPDRYLDSEPRHYTSIPFDAVEEQSLRGDFAEAEQIAREKSIPKIKASDAYRLEDIGLKQTEFELR